MALTPNINDPNRKKELARKKKDPKSFGEWESVQQNKTKTIPNPIKR